MTRRSFATTSLSMEAKIAESGSQTIAIVHTRRAVLGNAICGVFLPHEGNREGDENVPHVIDNKARAETMQLPGPVDELVVQSHSAGSVSGQIVVTVQATNAYAAGDVLIFDFPGFGWVDNGESDLNTLLATTMHPEGWANPHLVWDPENFTLTATVILPVQSRQVLSLRFAGLSNPWESKYV